MRPGTCLVFPFEELDERSEKIDWNKSVIGPDTPENMIERHDAWDDTNKVYKDTINGNV